jgi:4-alpha-glucanotransferase
MAPMSDDLARLADAYGVGAGYTDHRGHHREANPDAVRAVLAAMGVVAETPEQVDGALAAVRDRPWRRLVPPTTVAVQGDAARWALRVHVPRGTETRVRLELEDGGGRDLPAPIPLDPPITDERGGIEREARELALPDDLPLGVHRVAVDVADGPVRREEGVLIVAPAATPAGASRRDAPGDAPAVEPGWGWMLQLYALRSEASWGIGDLGDLRTLVRWSGAELGADFVVVNPLHAHAPVTPVEPSPYMPSSRRFADPLMLRVEDVPAYGTAAEAVRAEVDRIGGQQRARNRSERLDRDRAWEAKVAALELLHGADDGGEAFATFRTEHGAALEDWATFCALAERHGLPWQDWPEALHDPAGPAVAAAREELAGRVAFHAWLQWCCDLQLAAAQEAALDAGMAIGVIHDLAVGVHAGGADAWALRDDLARGVSVGAPPDAFNQRGQDWGLPPLRPDRLAETGYAPFREMMAAVLRHAGGIRIDHILGLFRLWWIADGRSAADGVYVRFPAEDLLAVLALEAHRAGAIVVGEDLGTVGEEVRAALRDADVFSSRLLYFEHGSSRSGPAAGGRLRADEYTPRSLASVTTHDLPTAAGWWADEAVRVQSRLGLLGDDTSLEAELEHQAREKATLRALLAEEGLIGEGEDDPTALREAMHAFLARCGSLLVAVQPADAVGDLRQPNLPGTIDEYPNWRLPVAAPPWGGEGPRPLTIEDLMADEGVARLARILREGRAERRGAGG